MSKNHLYRQDKSLEPWVGVGVGALRLTMDHMCHSAGTTSSAVAITLMQFQTITPITEPNAAGMCLIDDKGAV